MKKLIKEQNLWIVKVTENDDHPADPNEYRVRYIVHSWNGDGTIYFYVATGYHRDGVKNCKEVHVWYANKRMWSSFGTTIDKAIEGAMEDGWKHTKMSIA